VRQVNHAQLVYRHPDGRLGWFRTIPNKVTIEAVNWLATTGFQGGPQATSIYAMLIASSGYLSSDENDTHASHPGWSEWVALTPATRPIWQPSAANGGTLGTLFPATFTFTGDGFIKGTGLTTVATVGSLAGGVGNILYNTAIATTPLAVATGGTLDVSFVLRLLE